MNVMSPYYVKAAMDFAVKKHEGQLRNYTHEPYHLHLAEVAYLVAQVAGGHSYPTYTLMVAWLHDTIEDQGVTLEELDALFGGAVAGGVLALSDLEKGNRATRKEAARRRLSLAPDWVQDIKVADLLSNTPSIVQYDPKFAVTFLKEANALLDVLTRASPYMIASLRTVLIVSEDDLKTRGFLPS